MSDTQRLPTIAETERAIESYESKGDHLWIARSPSKTDYVLLEAAKKMIQLERENNQLREALTSCVEKLVDERRAAKYEYQNRYGRECFVTRFDNVLSHPAIQEILKRP